VSRCLFVGGSQHAELVDFPDPPAGREGDYLLQTYELQGFPDTFLAYVWRWIPARQIDDAIQDALQLLLERLEAGGAPA
jgi:hypothetical protein